MSRRRTAAPQRRARASEAALERKVGAGPAGRLSGTALVIVGIGLLVIVGLTAIVLFALLAPGQSATVGEPQAMDGRQHIDQGTAGGPYSSTPAASGPHWPEPLAWGVYPSPIPQEPVIHNLEHAGIVIWYQADQLSPTAVAELADYTRGWNASERYKVLVAPWAGADFGAPIAIVAWTWLLYLDEVDTELMDTFIDQHYGDGPEPGGGPGPPAQ
ncbi:MAG TPA: DUF3105 domain-containing protein [Candidatus Limnocylindria bacterium]|nr:DUF3105 domain-containing protein [Candidatus Limnocylindria bacterium]